VASSELEVVRKELSDKVDAWMMRVGDKGFESKLEALLVIVG